MFTVFAISPTRVTSCMRHKLFILVDVLPSNDCRLYGKTPFGYYSMLVMHSTANATIPARLPSTNPNPGFNPNPNFQPAIMCSQHEVVLLVLL